MDQPHYEGALLFANASAIGLVSFTRCVRVYKFLDSKRQIGSMRDHSLSLLSCWVC